MEEFFSRTELLLGKSKMQKLKNANVAIFGLGGVGSYTAEALCRSGIGKFTLIDNDKITLSNINRQLIALHSTVGRYKTEVMKERMTDINPDVEVTVFNCFYSPENADSFSFKGYSYIIDAIDTVTAKICLVQKAKEADVPVICSMGAGNKLNPQDFTVADIKNTSVCPLAKVMRKELKDRGIDGVKVVFSKELPLKPINFNGKGDSINENKENENLTKPTKKRKQIPGSVAFVPSVAGLIIAGEVIKDIVNL